jgi:hypothetical protein
MRPTPDNNAVTHFAVTNWRDIRKRFGIKQKNRRGHMYVLGKTGTGKSTLLLNMAAWDAQAGNGLALIDPHGDLAAVLLDHVPRRRIKDVIYFNPADLEYPIGFNPLKSVPPDQRHLVASGLIAVLKKVWPEFWGPRLEHILRHSILTLLELPGSTLLDLHRLLTDKDFREAILKGVTHPQVRQFWFFEFEKYSAWLRSEAISPILNKIGQFLVSTPLRSIVGQKKSAFDMRKAMDEGQILVVNLAKGKIGEDNAMLLGSLLVTEIQLAALSRVDLPENKRRAFYLYVDEAHNFLTLTFADILSEARKYGLNLILSHQYIEQMDEKMRAAILGNVGTIIAFRVGIEDAKILAREFYPVFGESDLVSLPNYHIYLRLMIEGMPSTAFSATTLPPLARRRSHKTEIIRSSRMQYGRIAVMDDPPATSNKPLGEHKTDSQQSLWL